VNDGCLSRLIEVVQVGHRRIEGEEAVERQRLGVAVELECIVAAQLDPVGIADRRHRGEPIECAAQHDGEEARVAAFGAGDARHMGPGKQRARAEQQLAAGRGVKGRSTEPRRHDHLHWNSGAINIRVSAWGLGFRAGDGAARLLGGERAERGFQHCRRVEAVAIALGEIVGDVEPVREPSSQAAFSSGKPRGDGGRRSGSPSRFNPGTMARMSPANRAARRRATFHSLGRLILTRSSDRIPVR